MPPARCGPESLRVGHVCLMQVSSIDERQTFKSWLLLEAAPGWT
jgi:hypothetical protein